MAEVAVAPSVTADTFDYYAVEPHEGDIQLGWKRAVRDLPDIFYTQANGGHWVFTRAEDIYAAYRDSDRFSSQFVAIPKEEHRASKFVPAEVDPPEHNHYRLIAAPVFTPSAVRGLEEQAQKVAQALIEGFHADGGCEFVHQFADRLPIIMFLSLMELPVEDHEALAPSVEAMTRNPDINAIARAFETMMGYLDEKIAERLKAPSGDPISRILAGRIGDRPISREEALMLSANLMFAGLDTVVSGLSFVIRFLAQNPAQRQRLIDEPGIVPEAIEELLRRHGITNLARTAAHDFDYKGHAIAKGDMVLLPTSLYGLDDARFPDAERVDFDRADKAHMIFGVGPHRCLGSHLARMELRVLLQQWLPRIPHFSIADPAGVVARSGRINAIKALPLAW